MILELNGKKYWANDEDVVGKDTEYVIPISSLVDYEVHQLEEKNKAIDEQEATYTAQLTDEYLLSWAKAENPDYQILTAIKIQKAFNEEKIGELLKAK